MILLKWYSWNDTPEMILLKWYSWNDTPEMILLKWYSWNDTPEMILLKWYSWNDTLEMILLKWYSWNDTPEMILLKWYSWNDTPEMILLKWYSWNDTPEMILLTKLESPLNVVKGRTFLLNLHPKCYNLFKTRNCFNYFTQNILYSILNYLLIRRLFGSLLSCTFYQFRDLSSYLKCSDCYPSFMA